MAAAPYRTEALYYGVLTFTAISYPQSGAEVEDYAQNDLAR